MHMNNCLDLLLMVSLASFVGIALPISTTVIVDYMSTRSYSLGQCNGTTLQNYTTSGGFFYHGTVDVVATVNGTEYSSFLYYPPLKNWQLGFMPKIGVDDWYDSLNKTSMFPCYINLKSSSEPYPAVYQWIEITGYYTIFVVCMFVIIGWGAIACTIQNRSKKRSNYLSIPDELPPPYTRQPVNYVSQKRSLYSSLNDELTTISV